MIIQLTNFQFLITNFYLNIANLSTKKATHQFITYYYQIFIAQIFHE